MNAYQHAANQVAIAQRIMEANLALARTREEQTRAKREQIRSRDLAESFSGGVPVHGKFLVNGPGEAHKVIEFPVSYLDPPVITFGFEIPSPNDLVWTQFNPEGHPEYRDPNNPSPGHPGNPASRFVPGEAPIITALVFDWISGEYVERRPEIYIPENYMNGSEGGAYSVITGAEIVTVCEGPEATKFVCHWTASGKAYGNPSRGGMGDEIVDRAGGKYNDGEYRMQVQWKPGSAGLYNGVWYDAYETPPGYVG
jgi:hypothetical protein